MVRRSGMARASEGCSTAFEREQVGQARQVARISEVTFPGPDLILGNYVEGFAEACEQIAADWPRAPGGADRFHVETQDAPGMIRTCDLCLRRAFRGAGALCRVVSEGAVLQELPASAENRPVWLHDAVSGRLGH
jgi:hypothetical protein